MATTELVLETAIDALTRRTLVVANLLGTLEAEIFQAPGFGSQFLRPGLVATRVGISLNVNTDSGMLNTDFGHRERSSVA